MKKFKCREIDKLLNYTSDKLLITLIFKAVT